jgi:glycosyltransferase involved in cell wall biosynthesis
MNNKKIVFIQPHLKFGGAENQTVLTLNRLADLGYDCSLLLHKKTGGLLPQLDKRIRVISLGFESHLLLPFGMLLAVSLLRKMQPSVIVTKLWSSMLLVGFVSKFVRKHKYLFYEDLDPTNHEKFISFGRVKKFLIAKLLRKNHTNLIANTHHVASNMKQEYGLPTIPRVIECSIDIDRCQKLSKELIEIPPTNGSVRVISIGSLVGRKGLLELKEVLADVPFPTEWLIVGEGPLREELSRPLRPGSKLSIKLIGGTPNPYPYLLASDMLIHGGLSESFGVVLIEALALDKPVIAYIAKGPLEIQNVTKSSRLFVGDIHSPGTLFEIIERFKTFGDTTQSGPHVLDKFSLDAVTAKWVQELD